jgi:alkylation response protein AidB-like acyl-CoA dehydrogenase
MAPSQAGGQGLSWLELSPLVRQIARVDSSVAHLFSYHYLGLTIPQLFGEPSVADHYWRRTVQERLFWCNALNPRDRRTTLKPQGEGFQLEGIKSFCSGSLDSDVMPTTAWLEGSGELVIVILPTRTPGVELIDDWDNIGQRQTSSGTVHFHQVALCPSQLFYPARQAGAPFASMRTLLAQQNLANLYLGLAEGALLEAVELGRERLKATSRGIKEIEPEQAAAARVLARDRIAQLWIQLQAADAHYQRSLEALVAAWQHGRGLTAEQRGRTAIAIATTKVLASEAALAISAAIFDRLGARYTATSYGLDRYWRNIRTLSLHDSAEEKLQEIGAYLIEQRWPSPGFYG